MSAAASDAGFFNRGLAAGTGLASFAENLSEEVEIVAASAVSSDVVGHGGAARIERGLHGVTDAVEQLCGFLLCDGGDATSGVDFGVKESFVGVDVADACDDSLVKEGGFYSGAWVFLKVLVKLIRGEFEIERVGAEFSEERLFVYLWSRDKFNEAEFALVVKEEIRVVGESDLNASVAVRERVEEAVCGVASAETG